MAGLRLLRGRLFVRPPLRALSLRLGIHTPLRLPRGVQRVECGVPVRVVRDGATLYKVRGVPLSRASRASRAFFRNLPNVSVTRGESFGFILYKPYSVYRIRRFRLIYAVFGR